MLVVDQCVYGATESIQAMGVPSLCSNKAINNPRTHFHFRLGHSFPSLYSIFQICLKLEGHGSVGFCLAAIDLWILSLSQFGSLRVPYLIIVESILGYDHFFLVL